MQDMIKVGSDICVTVDFLGKPTKYIATLDRFVRKGDVLDSDVVSKYYKGEVYSRHNVSISCDRLLLHKKLYLQMNGDEIYKEVNYYCAIPVCERSIRTRNLSITALNR